MWRAWACLILFLTSCEYLTDVELLEKNEEEPPPASSPYTDARLEADIFWKAPNEWHFTLRNLGQQTAESVQIGWKFCFQDFATIEAKRNLGNIAYDERWQESTVFDANYSIFGTTQDSLLFEPPFQIRLFMGDKTHSYREVFRREMRLEWQEIYMQDITF